jgi:hypothetical protein
MMEKLLFGSTSNRSEDTGGGECLTLELESRERYKVWLMTAELQDFGGFDKPKAGEGVRSDYSVHCNSHCQYASLMLSKYTSMKHYYW